MFSPANAGLSSTCGSGKTSSELVVVVEATDSSLQLKTWFVVVPARSVIASESRARWSQRVNNTRPKLSTNGLNDPDGECSIKNRSPVSGLRLHNPLTVGNCKYSSRCRYKFGEPLRGRSLAKMIRPSVPYV